MKHLSMIGCDTYHNFIRNFTRNINKVNEIITNTCNVIVDKQMVNEISMTITAKHTNNDAMHDITNDVKQCDDS